MGSEKRRVTQETFDAVVEDNMENFGLTREEAIVEARAELTAAGVVDFGGIIMGNEVRTAVDRVLNGLSCGEWGTVVMECQKGTKDLVETVGTNGGIGLLVNKIKELEAGGGETNESLKVVPLLCDGCRRNRKKFRELGGIALLKELIERSVQEGGNSLDKATLLKACSATIKQMETAKQLLAAGDTLGFVVQAVAAHDGNEGLLRTGCALLYSLLATDDNSVVATEVFNRARVLAGIGGASAGGLIPLSGEVEDVITILWRALGDQGTKELRLAALKADTIVGCMKLLRAIAIADEICAEIVKTGFLRITKWLLRERRSDVATVVVASGLLRNISARDECKDELLDTLQDLEAIMELHGEEKALADHFCGIASSVCLRRPDLAKSLMKNGILNRLVELMRIHEHERSVQLMACLALRNAVVRDEEVCKYVRERTEAEKWLRCALMRFSNDCRDAAYGALRDLDLLKNSEINGSDIENKKNISVVITRS